VRRTPEQTRFIAVFLAPAFLLFTIFVATPSVRALGYSLQKWDGLGEAQWVGFRNFVQLFQDSDLFLTALWHNIILMTGGGAGIMVLSLFFAAVLHRRVRGAPVFRVAFFFPNVIASVAIALLWVLLYSTTEFGVVNAMLGALQDGLHRLGVASAEFDLPVPFVSKRYLIYSMIPMMIWTATGFYMVLFLAAMESIPETFYEAALLDGASPFAQFRHITLPLIREVLTVGLVFLVIGSLKFFEAVWVMDNGWPTRETHVLATLLYQKVFSEYNVGYGSAVAVLLFIMVFFATLATLRLSRREALEY
jgi:ABC-type sugar transport system permease subunit